MYAAGMHDCMLVAYDVAITQLCIVVGWASDWHDRAWMTTEDHPLIQGWLGGVARLMLNPLYAWLWPDD